MCPLITYNNSSTELKIAPVSDNTTFTLRVHGNVLLVNQNDAVIGALQMPIMKVVRALRRLYPMAKYEVK